MARGESHLLPAGYRVLGRYEIVEPVGVGVAGIRYAARGTGGGVVRVEEYFPARCAARRGDAAVEPATVAVADEFLAGLAAFLTTSRLLANIAHGGLVDVIECDRDNGTGYVVTAAVAGESLDVLAARHGRLAPEEVAALLRQPIEGLALAHEAGVLHRQIHPGAIVVGVDGAGVLREFGHGVKVVGGPRQAFEERATRLADVTPGFAALEQYSVGGREGPWTDIYAIGAVMYRCITGASPPDAPYRAVRDEREPVAGHAADAADSRVLTAVDAALAVPIAARPQSLAVWRGMVFGERGPTPARQRVGRTSARGPVRLPSARSEGGARPGESAPDRRAETTGMARLLRWSLPALAATVLMTLVTWVDTGVLRDAEAETPVTQGEGASAVLPEFTDVLASGEPAPRIVRVPLANDRASCDPPACDPEAGAVEAGQPSTFGIGKYEVTEAEFGTFAAGADVAWRGVAGGSYPAVGVSWHDAAAYASWLSQQTGRDYRLPTEAEWEHGARAGRDTLPRDAVAVNGAGVVPGAAPVGSGGVNPWGLHHMSGNVAEWVLDCGDGDGARDVGENGRACGRRVRRGSSWVHPLPNAGAASRVTMASEDRTLDTGFRIAVSLEPPE